MTVFMIATFSLLGFILGYFISKLIDYVRNTKYINGLEDTYNKSLDIVNRMARLMEQVVSNSQEAKEESNEQSIDKN